MRSLIAWLVALAAWVIWHGAAIPMDDDPQRFRDSGLL